MVVEFEGYRIPEDNSVKLRWKNPPAGKFVHFLLQGSVEASQKFFSSACTKCPALGKTCSGVERIDNWGYVYAKSQHDAVNNSECLIPGKVVKISKAGLAIWKD